MLRSKTTAFIEQSDFGASISVFLLDAAHVTGRAIAAPVVFKVFDDQEQHGLAPTFEMTKSDAQRLMDELWKIGLRPSEGSGSAGSLAATERQLADMRTIAIGALASAGVVQPKSEVPNWTGKPDL